MTVLYVHSGSGNSLWAAQKLAPHLGSTEVVSMALHPTGPVRSTADCIGLVFPVHMWGVPRLPLDFVRRLELAPTTYVFGVAVNAGQVSRTLVQLGEELSAKGLKLSAGYSLLMPSNYLPWGGPGPAEEIERRFAGARLKLENIARGVRERWVAPVEQGPLWQRTLLTLAYKGTFSRIATMDKDFFVDARCNGCGTCVRVCPVANVRLVGGTPRWSGKCEQCLACAQWCPTKALQMGKKTAGFERYHHPEVRVADMVALAGKEPAEPTV